MCFKAEEWMRFYRDFARNALNLKTDFKNKKGG